MASDADTKCMKAERIIPELDVGYKMTTVKDSGPDEQQNTFEKIKFLWTSFLRQTTLHGCSVIPQDQNHWIRSLLEDLYSQLQAWGTPDLRQEIQNGRHQERWGPGQLYTWDTNEIFIGKVDILNMLFLNLVSYTAVKTDRKFNNFVDFIKDQGFGEFNVTIPSRQDMEKLNYLPLKDFGVQIDDLIVIATVNGRRINVSSEFESVTSVFGRCFTFNKVREDGRGGDIFLSTGGSLQLTLNITEEAYISWNYATGAQIMIHDPRDLPSPFSLNLVLPPGFLTFVSLTANRMKFLPKPYKSFGDDYCVESLEVSAIKLKWHSEYTWSGCVEECLFVHSVNQCKCRPNMREFPEFLSDRICSEEEVKNCILAIIRKIFINILSQNDTNCTCPQPCEYTHYDVRTSLMAFPSKSAANFLMARGAASSYQDLRDNYLSVNIAYERMILHHTEHVPEINDGDILGRLGGQMGLFLGASILTLVELAETVLWSLLVLGKAVIGPYVGLK